MTTFCTQVATIQLLILSYWITTSLAIRCEGRTLNPTSTWNTSTTSTSGICKSEREIETHDISHRSSKDYHEKHPLNNVVLMHFSNKVWNWSGCQSHPTTLGCHANGQMYVSFQQQSSQSCTSTTYCWNHTWAPESQRYMASGCISAQVSLLGE